jgi:hypothetical protein
VTSYTDTGFIASNGRKIVKGRSWPFKAISQNLPYGTRSELSCANWNSRYTAAAFVGAAWILNPDGSCNEEYKEHMHIHRYIFNSCSQ